MSHHCHATGCEVSVPPKKLMCRRHWRMVPRDMQNAVWRHYRAGQEIDKRPSGAYLRAMLDAIKAVALLEGQPRPHPPADLAPLDFFEPSIKP
jgi:hypothetical protein